MAEVITQTASTEIKPVAAVQAPEVIVPKEDLITRASKVTLDKPIEAVKPAEESIKLDQATIDKISDPTLKAAVTEAHKSMQADYTRKTQALASERATLKQQLESSGQYTPDKIQQLLNDPSFIRAAQDYQRINAPQQTQQTQTGNSELTDEEFSYLQPEQQKLYLKTKQMEQTLGVVNSRLAASEIEKQDMGLKSKYANYNPQSVNDIYNGMMNGTIQATREHLWKVQDYDSAVQRAYQLGLSDRKLEMGEKVAASSQTNGVSVTPSSDVPQRVQNETGVEYFKRIAAHNFAKFKK